MLLSGRNPNLFQAIKVYKTELAKYGKAADPDKSLIQSAEDVIIEAQCTTLESHLCRALRKPEDQRASSCNKYLGLFATVPPSSVQPQVMEKAEALRQALKGSRG